MTSVIVFATASPIHPISNSSLLASDHPMDSRTNGSEELIDPCTASLLLAPMHIFIRMSSLCSSAVRLTLVTSTSISTRSFTHMTDALCPVMLLDIPLRAGKLRRGDPGEGQGSSERNVDQVCPRYG